jgi:hypothetical protein
MSSSVVPEIDFFREIGWHLSSPGTFDGRRSRGSKSPFCTISCKKKIFQKGCETVCTLATSRSLSEFRHPRLRADSEATLRALLSEERRLFRRRKAFWENLTASSQPRLACESQRYGGRRSCAQTSCVPVVQTGERPGQRLQTANHCRPESRSGRPQRVGRKAGRDFWEPAGSMFALLASLRHRTKAALSGMDQT